MKNGKKVNIIIKKREFYCILHAPFDSFLGYVDSFVHSFTVIQIFDVPLCLYLPLFYLPFCDACKGFWLSLCAAIQW